MIFIDGIAISQKFRADSIKQLAGVRRISFREAGDVGRDGVPVVEQEVIGETLNAAWIQGSHETRLQVKSDGSNLLLMGNPGRFGRGDNLFNLDLFDTVKRANEIVADQGFPWSAFRPGQKQEFEESIKGKLQADYDTRDEEQRVSLLTGRPVRKKAFDVPEERWDGSRVWSLHMTQNYRTGSPENAKAIVDYSNTQSVARVKKSRLGASTVVWGNIRYCQTELYIKHIEMMAHCRNQEERELMEANPVYQYARDNGIVRVEVKCAKDYLKEKRLTYLGAWGKTREEQMERVAEIFREKAAILERCRLDVEELDVEALDKKLRVHYLAWMQGVDVGEVLRKQSRATFYRYHKKLRDHCGIDISEPRNVTVMVPRMRTITLDAVTPPHWYMM